MIDIYVDISNAYTTVGSGTSGDPYSWSQFITRFGSTDLSDLEMRFHLRGKRELTGTTSFYTSRSPFSQDFLIEIVAWDPVTYGHPVIEGLAYSLNFETDFVPGGFFYGRLLVKDIDIRVDILYNVFNTFVYHNCYFDTGEINGNGVIQYFLGCTFKRGSVYLINYWYYVYHYILDCYFGSLDIITFGDEGGSRELGEVIVDNNIFENNLSDNIFEGSPFSDLLPFMTDCTFGFSPTNPIPDGGNTDSYANRNTYSYVPIGISDESNPSVIARWSSYSYNWGDGIFGSPPDSSITTYNKGLFDTDRKAQGAFWFSVLLTADFSATPLSGKAPLSVQFQDLTTGNPDTWSWNFGDGNTSSLQNPNHIYTTAGTYTVTLTASNASSSDSVTKTDYITVSPDADFSANPLQGRVSLNVQFQDLSTGNPNSWNWDFGDGSSPSSLQNPKHTYTQSGIYTVVLTVSRDGISDTETKTNYITVLPRLELTSYDPETGEPIETTDELNFGILIQGQHSYRPVVLKVVSPDTTSNLKLFLERKTEDEEYAYYTNPTFIPFIKSGGPELQNHLIETPDASFSSPNGISIPLTDKTSDFIWLDVYIPSDNRRISPNFRFIFESI